MIDLITFTHQIIDFVFPGKYCTFAPEMATIRKIGTVIARKQPKSTRQYIEYSTSCGIEGVPVMYVGLKNAKEHIEHFNILDKNPSDGTYWTFLKTEKREDYEVDVEKFYDSVLLTVAQHVRYYYINPFKISFQQAKKILSILFSNERKCIYNSNGMLYFMYNGDSFGVSLDILKYVGIKTEKWLARLHRCESIEVYDESTKWLFWLDRELRSKNLTYLMPYLLN